MLCFIIAIECKENIYNFSKTSDLKLIKLKIAGRSVLKYEYSID